MKKLLSSLISIALVSGLHGAAQSSALPPAATSWPIYAIPGQNGAGSSPAYVAQQLGVEQRKVQAIGTPSWAPDLGQSRCLAYLKGISEPGIIHATSQGTATALRYAAQNPTKVKALILEANLASGNSAIHHTVGGPLMRLTTITQLPGSYYWLPYFAKALFPFYSPSGTQPIHVIDNIAKDIPVIIAHDPHDPQLSYHDACALYYKFRASGNNNTYLITAHDGGHIGVLRNQPALVQEILAKHGIGESWVSTDSSLATTAARPDRIVIRDEHNRMVTKSLSDYQPEHTQFKPAYDALIAREKIHTKVGYGVNAALAVGTLYAASRLVRSVRVQELLRKIPRLPFAQGLPA